MASDNTSRLYRFKLGSTFNGHDVTHRTFQPDLPLQRDTKITTVWHSEREVGIGGLGVVWLQKQEGTADLRAVKIISKAHLQPQEMGALMEFQDHPALFVQFLGWFEDTHTIHIAMEYVQYGDLGQYITRHRAEAKTEAKRIISQILEGLGVLHERDICHRNMKPQNVLIASLSPIWVKITDFGLLRWSGISSKLDCGAAHYQAPELLGLLPRQLKTGIKEYTKEMDVWAVGAMIHQILTSEIPFLDKYQDVESTTIAPDQEPAIGSVIDTDLLFNFCRGLKPFPSESLQENRVPIEGIDFVRSLMVADPRGRVSAKYASRAQWLVEIDSLERDSGTGMPGSRLSSYLVDGTHDFDGSVGDPGSKTDAIEGPAENWPASKVPNRYTREDLRQALQSLQARYSELDAALLPAPSRTDIPVESRSVSPDFMPDQSVLLIALVGRISSGKSTFATMANTEMRIIVGRMFGPHRNVHATGVFDVDGHMVRLINTPSSNDDGMTESRVVELTADWMKENYGVDRRLDGIIYLQKITDIRLGYVAESFLMMFSDICAPNFLENTVLLTTKWDKSRATDIKTSDESEVALKEVFWKSLLDSGAMYARSYHKMRGCKDIVSMIAQKQSDGVPVVDVEHPESLNIETPHYSRTDRPVTIDFVVGADLRSETGSIYTRLSRRKTFTGRIRSGFGFRKS